MIGEGERDWKQEQQCWRWLSAHRETEENQQRKERAGAPVEETPATRQWPIPPAGLALAGRRPGKLCQPAAGAQIRFARQAGGREGGERKSQGRMRIAKETAPGCTSFLARQGGFPALGLPLLPPSDRSWPGACRHLPRGKLLSRGAGLSGLRP